MIITERYVVQITADNEEVFRTLKAANRRSSELMFAGIPHVVVAVVTRVLAIIDDEKIAPDALRNRTIRREETGAFA